MENKILRLSDRYTFPDKISFVNYKGNVLAISVQTGNWIVLTQKQTDLFKLLNDGHSIEDSIKLFTGTKQDVENVFTQIEARHFYNTATVKNNGKGAHIYLTNACNLRCPHCYMKAGMKYAEEMTDLEIMRVLDILLKGNH